ncbi:MAG: GntR family transcriptional regulator [Thermodesulfobacteriota bacterium]
MIDCWKPLSSPSYTVGDLMAKYAPKKNIPPPAEGHTQKAYQGIRNMLFHNEIAPGQKISYRDLSDRLGMSQTPVIQALKWLEFQQLVRHEPNRGYYTAPLSLQEVAEIYELRELIELDLLSKTLRKGIDTPGRKRLRAALEAHMAASREVYLYDRLLRDMEFHLTLAALSECRVHQKTLQNLFDLLYLKYGGNFLFSTSLEAADTDHRTLFEHIESGDTSKAKAVLAGHIRRVKSHVIQGVDKLLSATRG